MSGILQGQLLSINFVPLNGTYFTVSLYVCNLKTKQNWTFESFNVLTMEIEFFPSPEFAGIVCFLIAERCLSGGD